MRPPVGDVLVQLVQEDRRPGACWSFSAAQRLEGTASWAGGGSGSASCDAHVTGSLYLFSLVRIFVMFTSLCRDFEIWHSGRWLRIVLRLFPGPFHSRHVAICSDGHRALQRIPIWHYSSCRLSDSNCAILVITDPIGKATWESYSSGGRPHLLGTLSLGYWILHISMPL